VSVVIHSREPAIFQGHNGITEVINELFISVVIFCNLCNRLTDTRYELFDIKQKVLILETQCISRRE